MTKSYFILFGNQPLASWVASKLLERKDCSILGVICSDLNRDYEHHGIDLPPLREYALNHDLNILNVSDISHIVGSKKVMALTIRWPNLLSKETLFCFKKGVLNFHGGFLPRWRGLNIPTHVILEGAKTSGATIHFLDSKVDTGPILLRKSFSVDDLCTAFDIFLKTQVCLQELFVEALTKSMLDIKMAIPQKNFLEAGDKEATYTSTNPAGIRERSLDEGAESLLRAARAFEFPGYERAFIRIRENKFYLTPEFTSSSRIPKNLIDPFRKLTNS